MYYEHKAIYRKNIVWHEKKNKNKKNKKPQTNKY